MQTRFVFFDLGNVLLRFSLEKMGRQGAELTGCTPEAILDAVFGDGMYRRVECGYISEEEFYEEFRRKTGTNPDPIRLSEALSDIFTVVDETQLLVHRLASEGFPRGVLSNTGTVHWNYCCREFPFLLNCFPKNHVLSFRVGAMKPDRAIYEAAWNTAKQDVPDIEPGEILFIDDVEKNVAGAGDYGLDAVQFVSKEQLAEAIESRGLGPLEPN